MSVDKKALIDTTVIQLQMVEGTDGKKLKVRGEFARADTATANNRVYTRQLWERECRRLGQSMQERKVLGELDHPCLTTDDWRVLTVEGWKPFREVQVGDRVWSREDGCAVVSTVTGIVDEPYTGKAYQVKGRSIDATFTPAHKFLLEKSGMEVMVTLEELVQNLGTYTDFTIPVDAPLDVQISDVREGVDLMSLQIQAVDHNGRIYCLSTTRGSFYMEREGKAFWTGNSDGKTLLSRSSHLITSLELTEDGILLGEAEVMDTSKGKDLQAILKSGARIGVSSRGFGSTKADTAGKEVVQEDYRLATFDFVADPADTSAYPESFYESKEPHMKVEDQKLQEELETRIQEEVEARVATAVTQKEQHLREEFESQLIPIVGKLKSDLKEEVRGELLSDPSVAGARAALESVKSLLRPYVLPEDTEVVLRSKETEIRKLKEQVADRELKILSLKEDLENVSKVTKEAGYTLFLEKRLQGVPDANLIRNLVGDVTQFASSEELGKRLDAAIADLTEKREEDMQVLESLRKDEERTRLEKETLVESLRQEHTNALQEERSRIEKDREAFQQELEALREDNQSLLSAVEKSLQANKQQSLLLYAERQLLGNPRAAKIRRIVESAAIETQEQVDVLIEEHSVVATATEDLENVRTRVRRMSSGRSFTPQEEETSGPRLQQEQRAPLKEDYNGLGMSLSALQKMSGI